MRTAVLGLIAFLSACYQSNEPLLDARVNGCPIDQPTYFGAAVITPASDDGSRTPVEIAPLETGECALRTSGGEARLVFREVGQDYWLVQFRLDERLRAGTTMRANVGYALVQREGDGWLATPPSCGEERFRDIEAAFEISVTDVEGLKACTAPDTESLVGVVQFLAQLEFHALVIFEPR